MACPARTKTGKICNRKTKQFGVCAQHKNYAYIDANNPHIQPYVQDLIMLNTKWITYYQRCQAVGVYPEVYWGTNYTQDVDVNMIPPGDAREAVDAMQKLKQRVRTAKEVIDPYLAYNLMKGVQTILNGETNLTPYLQICVTAAQPYVQ